MFNICRLCLCTSNDLNKELFANEELLRKISLCLHVDFVINDSLPQQVCTCCLDKLEEILQFHEKVKSNQQLLISYLELGEESLTSFYCSLDANIKEEKKVFEELDAELTCEISESNDLVENDYSSDDNVTLSSIKNTKKRKYKNGTKNLIREQPEEGVSELNIEVSTDVNDITCIAEDNTSPMRLRNRIKKEKRQNASLNLSQSKKIKVRKLDSEAQAKNVKNKYCEAQENSHTSSVLNDEIYKCLTCFEPFNCKKTLGEHYKLKHRPVVQKWKVDEFIAIHGTKLKCTKCEKVCDTKESAKYHVRRAHLYKNRPFLCKLCGASFQYISGIISHAGAHDQGIRMACKFKCGFTTAYSDNLKVHETSQHKNDDKYKKKYEAQENSLTSSALNDEIYKCLTCFEPSNCKKSLREHYKLKHQPVVEHSNVDEFIAIHGTHFKCTKCEKVCDTKKRADYHVLIAHLHKNRPYLCKLCGASYTYISGIMKHAGAHDQGTRMACSFKCGYTTTNSNNLKSHETHRHKNDFKYTCEKCGKGFIYKSLLEEHDNIHTGHKPFVCDLCGIAYSLKPHLAKHRLKVHSETSDPNKSKSWHCLHCPRLLDSKHALKEHLSKEHGIKTVYQCDTCGKTFFKSCNLSTHVKVTHEKIRPHICSICKKDFESRSRMKRHEALHFGIKGQVCLTCGKTYTQSYALNLHITKKHGVEARTCEKCEKVFPTQFVFVKHKEICK